MFFNYYVDKGQYRLIFKHFFEGAANSKHNPPKFRGGFALSELTVITFKIH